MLWRRTSRACVAALPQESCFLCCESRHGPIPISTLSIADQTLALRPSQTRPKMKFPQALFFAIIFGKLGAAEPAAVTSTQLVLQTVIPCQGRKAGELVCASSGKAFGICRKDGYALQQALAPGDKRCSSAVKSTSTLVKVVPGRTVTTTPAKST